MDDAVRAICGAQRCVVFTGAGASADSGIGTFRGNGGAWSGIVGMLSLAMGGTPFGWRWFPSLVWSRFVKDFYGPIVGAAPNDGHVALTELQQGRFRNTMAVITMNVDGLHQAAGAANVMEVHGSVRKFRCMECGKPANPAEPLNSSKQPRCEQPGCVGRIRPDVTLFTEGLPADEWNRAANAIEALVPGDVVLVIGTSSVVYPAASLPERAARRGATLIEFNMELPTPLSKMASIQVPGKAAETLRQCVDMVLNQ